MKAYQFLYTNGQETCYLKFELTNKFYTSEQACYKDLNNNAESGLYFKIICPLIISVVTGKMAEVLTEHER